VRLAFDRFLRAGRRQFTRAPDAMTARQADCAVQVLRGMGAAHLEHSMVAADAGVAQAIAAGCITAADMWKQLASGIRQGAGPGVDSDCIIGRAHETITTGELRAMATELGSGESTRIVQRAITAAAIACAGSAQNIA